MGAEAQIAASRASGAKSRGPTAAMSRAIPARNGATHIEIAKQRENPQFAPQDDESQHASAARDFGQNMRLMDRYERRRSYERAVENLYQLSDRRKNRKFPNEPKKSGE